MNRCKHKDERNIRCHENALTVPDKSKPSEIIEHETKICGLNVSWPSMPSKHGLCYYHHKISLGLFSDKRKELPHFLNTLDKRFVIRRV